STASRPLPEELREYIARFAEPNPVECGQFFLAPAFVDASAADLERAVNCARENADARQSFWTAKQDQGIDSLLFQGLIGTRDGTIYRFSFDGAPCGNPCRGRFSIERCVRPIVNVDRANRASFRCQQ